MCYYVKVCNMKALKIESAVTGRGGGGCGYRKQSISWRIRLRIGRHKKHKPMWLTSPVNAATATESPIVFDSSSYQVDL